MAKRRKKTLTDKVTAWAVKKAKRKIKKWNKQPSQWVVVGFFVFVFLQFIYIMIQQMVYSINVFLSSLTIWNWISAVLVLVVGSFAVYKVVDMFRRRISDRDRKERLFRIRRGANMNMLQKMDPTDFEHYIADVYGLMGYQCEVTPQTGDGGMDIILNKGKKMYLVECKRYESSNKVTRPHIQKFHSAIVHMKAEGGYFVTTSSFTGDAVAYAKGKGIELIDGNKLLNLIDEVTELGVKELGYANKLYEPSYD